LFFKVFNLNTYATAYWTCFWDVLGSMQSDDLTLSPHGNWPLGNWISAGKRSHTERKPCHGSILLFVTYLSYLGFAQEPPKK
jgi:hypothetical protein